MLTDKRVRRYSKTHSPVMYVGKKGTVLEKNY